jgi:hypothetical protein
MHKNLTVVASQNRSILNIECNTLLDVDWSLHNMLPLPASSRPPLPSEFSEANNSPSNSAQVKPGHIQLRHLQQRLSTHPLNTLTHSDQDIQERRELETQLILMVRWNLQKTTPAYQEEAAQMIVNNWDSLSGDTKKLMTHLCGKHLQEPVICSHYKKTLETILARVRPADTSTIQTQTPEEIAPSTSEIQEEPLSPPEADQLPQNKVRWLDEVTPDKQLAKVLTPPLPFAPTYKQGHKIRWFENKDWRALKNELKKTYVETQWGMFAAGINSANTEQLRDCTLSAMQTVLGSRQISDKLQAKAEQYISKKATKALYQLDEQGHGFFRTKGTTLHSRVYRCAQNYYQLLTHNSSETKKAIETQQGTKYTGPVFLGSGAAGRVQLAKNLVNNTIVAAKVADSKTIEDEHTILSKLPTNRYFSTIRDFAANPKKLGQDSKEGILFMDFQARGTLTSIAKKLKKLAVPEQREKATKTLARQLIEAVHTMHQQGIYHRDLKPENILFSQQGVPVICDFGTASETETVSGPYVGTFDWSAPEEINEQTNRNVRQADYYSLGQILYTVLKTSGLSHGQPTDHPLGSISNKLINPNPSRRPTTQALLERDYFKGEDRYTGPDLLKALEMGKAPEQRAS